MKRYIIVSAYSLEELESEVNLHFEKGYQLYGEFKFHHFSSLSVFYQSMILGDAVNC